MESFSVDPGQLRAAVTEATRAGAGREAARSRVDWAHGHVPEGVAGRRPGDPDGEFLTGMEKALTATAAIYEQVDAEIAAAVGPQP